MIQNAEDLPIRRQILIEQLDCVPLLVQALLDAPAISAGNRTRFRTSRPKVHHSMPLLLKRMDQLDELWTVLWELVDGLSEQRSEALLRMRRRQRLLDVAGMRTVRGYRTSNRTSMLLDTETVIRLLISNASALLLDARLEKAVEELQQHVFPLLLLTGAGPRGFFHKNPCRLCGSRAVRLESRASEALGYRGVCGNCGTVQPLR